MSEPNYNPQVKDRKAYRGSMESKAKVQMRYWDDLIEKQKHRRPACAVCGVQTSDTNLIYMVIDDIHLCLPEIGKNCQREYRNDR